MSRNKRSDSGKGGHFAPAEAKLTLERPLVFGGIMQEFGVICLSSFVGLMFKLKEKEDGNAKNLVHHGCKSGARRRNRQGGPSCRRKGGGDCTQPWRHYRYAWSR